MSEITVRVSSGEAAETAAALIWARATARRDGREQRDVAETLPGVRRRLALDGATLLMAWRDDAPVGFAVVAPQLQALELFYLAVDRPAWGAGVASRLLRAVDDHARSIGHAHLTLWVIADNERAVATYERAGWTRTDDVQQLDAGRTEARFVRRLDS
ncbi:MAG: GNAT family N-acetyltransferase [Aeromicrobium sp.]